MQATLRRPLCVLRGSLVTCHLLTTPCARRECQRYECTACVCVAVLCESAGGTGERVRHLEAVTLGDTADVDHLVLLEHRLDGHLLLEELHGVVNLVGNLATVDLDLCSDGQECVSVVYALVGGA